MKIKRWLSAFLCILLCIGLMPTMVFAAGEEFKVTYELTGMTANDQPTTATKGTTLAIKLTTVEGYKTPDSIRVKVGEEFLTQGSDFTVWEMGDGTWLAVNIMGASITDDITIIATAIPNEVDLSDNANLSAIEYYDGGLWKNISLSEEQLQEALTSDGVNILMSHGCLDNQYIMPMATLEDSKASASYDILTRLEDGKCTFTIKVTSEDKTKTNIYTLNFSIDPTHEWSVTKWNWAEDYSSATAEFICQENPDHTEQSEAEISNEIMNVGCEDNGEIAYTASVTLDGNAYTDRKVIISDPIGHDWSKVEWNWEDDCSRATATFTCANDTSHTQKITAEITSITTEATSTEDGQTVYTATVEFNGETYTDSKTVVIPATGTATDEGTTSDTDTFTGDNQTSDTGTTTDSPQTGDSNNIILWIAVLLAAGAVLASTIFYSRKKKYSK